MMTMVLKISDVVTHYALHCLHANVQFYSIEKNMQSMKTDTFIIYMVPYHKQNVFQMRYQEGKVDYYG